MSYAQADLVKEILAIEEQLPTGRDWSAVELAPEDWNRLVRLARGAVLPARRPFPLAVLACSATKGSVACAARDLYSGDLFRAGRQLAEMVADNYVILSAQHGVVEPDQVLEPYDMRLDAMSQRARVAWGAEAALCLARHIDSARRGPVLWLAGIDYWKPLEKWFVVDARQTYKAPLRGLGIGEQKAKLKALIAEAEAQGYGPAHAAAEARE